MTIDSFLKEYEENRLIWVRSIHSIPVGRLSEPILSGDWSAKNIIAHINWYEREMIEVIRLKSIIGSDWWQLPVDDRNHRIYLSIRGKSIDDILVESNRVYEELYAAVGTLADEDLSDSSQWKNWPPYWKDPLNPGKIIASNSFEHYRDHLPDLERLRTA